MNKHYDYLIVGAGLFGSVFSYEMRQKGKTCLVIDKRDHLAGNIYTREVRGIQVHEYGAHIFLPKQRRKSKNRSQSWLLMNRRIWKSRH